MPLPLGTIINVLAVIAGSSAGLLLQRGFPVRYRRILLTAGGLATLALGAQMAIGSSNPLVLIGSLYLGGLCGEAIGIEAWLERMGERVKGAGTRSADLRSAHPIGEMEEEAPPPEAGTPSGFSQGLVTAFLVFCVGPMTIVGALNEGINGDHSLLLVKSMLDLATSFALAASFGRGVLFSFIPLAVFQLAITAIGAVAGQAFTDNIVVELTAVGGALIIGLGLNLLGIARLKVANLLPALLIVVLIMLLLR